MALVLLIKITILSSITQVPVFMQLFITSLSIIYIACFSTIKILKVSTAINTTILPSTSNNVNLHNNINNNLTENHEINKTINNLNLNNISNNN